MKRTLLASAIILALAATPTVFAKGGKPPPHDETGNNLSFATKFIPDLDGAPPLRLACEATAVPPDANDPQCTLFPGYWCQKTAADWQAACITTGDSVPVTASWGANLLGDAPLKAGRPIRVEMALTESAGLVGVGYPVTNLTPELEDRLATYGTSGIPQKDAYVVWDAGAELLIEKCTDSTCAEATGTPIFDGPMQAEINSIGRVVYGFNWGVAGKADAAQPGFYKLTFFADRSEIVSAPYALPCPTENCTFVIIEVTQSAGGGGGGRK